MVILKPVWHDNCKSVLHTCTEIEMNYWRIMLLKPNQWHFAVVCVTALLAAGAQAQETTATPNNLGFQVDSIQDPSGSIDFADQFEAGVSTVEVTHKVNLLECVTYNNEET